MSGVQVEVTLLDIDVEAQVDKLIAAGQSRPAMRDVSRILRAETDDRFQDEEAPDGTPWQQSIRAREEGGTTLQDSGQLASSVSSDYGDGYAAVGTNKIYAAIHQLGGIIRAKSGGKLKFRLGGRFASVDQVKIPKRPFLGLSVAGEGDVEDRVLHHIRMAS